MNFKIVATAFLLFFTCATLSAQVSFVSGEKGTITVRTSGNGKGINDAIANAEKDVFYMLLFRGIAGSEQSSALITTREDEAQQKYKAYLDPLLSERYPSFIISAVQDGEPVKGKHSQYSVMLDVTVNVTALRKDMEANQVIRKFGF
ncbi:MAG: hypothetical protein P4L41_15865 [Flavipsychrobacter sp.]|nr:hypothetical protein [Flavipsychrobacter sp.]